MENSGQIIESGRVPPVTAVQNHLVSRFFYEHTRMIEPMNSQTGCVNPRVIEHDPASVAGRLIPYCHNSGRVVEPEEHFPKLSVR